MNEKIKIAHALLESIQIKDVCQMDHYRGCCYRMELSTPAGLIMHGNEGHGGPSYTRPLKASGGGSEKVGQFIEKAREAAALLLEDDLEALDLILASGQVGMTALEAYFDMRQYLAALNPA